jgi:hypothetical protein
MKHTLALFSLFLAFLPVRGQESVTLPLTDAGQIWSVTEFVLRERNIPLQSFSAFANVFISSPFEYSVLTVKNRACYHISIRGSVLTADLTFREYFTTSGWAPTTVPISDFAQNEFLKPLVKRIAEVANNPEKFNTIRETSILFPVYVQASTVNDLTMYINDSRKIGDQIMLSGKIESSRPMKIRSFNQIKVTTENGTALHTDKGSVAGQETNYLSQTNLELTPGVSIPFDFLLDGQGENVGKIQAISFEMYEPAKTSFKFFDIPIPMTINAKLKPGCIEIRKNIYLTFLKQEAVEGKLRIHFMLENKSGKNQDVYPTRFALTDKAGTCFKDFDVYIGGNKQYSRFQLATDMRTNGYVDFTGNIPFENIQMLQFSELQYANFTLGKIVLNP